MKTAFFFMSAIILAMASFLGGTWYSHRNVGNPVENERRILHYVDPMNPANVSDKPGIAPCGMPMEPVYGDPESADAAAASSGNSTISEHIRVSTQKQQIIGVKTGKVEKMPGLREIRVPGRITPDENRIYPLIASIDGWIGNIQGSTVGSLVKKDQLMTELQVFNYDFFTWQQRYLAEFANARRDHRGYPTALQPGAGQGSSPPPAAVSPDAASQPDPSPTEPSSDAASQDGRDPNTAASGDIPPESRQAKSRLAVMQGVNRQPLADPQGYYPYTALNINKSRLELLNLGVKESQLEKLSQSSQFITAMELRSPVNGLVIGRGVSANQRVEKGAECFRVADIGRVWIVADVFSSESDQIRPGLAAKIYLPSRNRPFEARVSDVPPRFDPATRILKVRLEMDNPRNTFLPDMVVDIKFQVPLPEALTVPASAVLDSGRRQTVYVVQSEGYFEPRPVVTGWRSGDRVEIIEGLVAGEQIVVSGNFLLDSESRMRLASARLTEKADHADPAKPQQLSNDSSTVRQKPTSHTLEHVHD